MKASIQWLRELVPGLDASARDVAARFTKAGLEIEAVIEYGAGAEACIVASVVSMRPHPSKSGLRLVTVDRGGAGGALEVICGAPNVPDPGGLVVLAPLGAHLPAKGMTIEKRAIAGVVSEGMLCSEAELGLTDDSDGILVLPAGSAKAGQRFVDAVPSARDTILEIGLGANRPDGLGHIGLAREIAALFEIAWKPPTPAAPARTANVTAESLASVAVEDGDRCPHYGASAVVDVAIAPSPLWVRYRLAALGVRAISNVVDVTNLVMLEYGHPMHAFDLDRVRGARIVVRRAREGEPLTTLDGVERKLSSDDLVIADGEGPVGLGGVMGGANSEIATTTKRVLFECAYFDPRGVRRTARRHGLHTDASHRFERGVDPGDVDPVLARATALTCELAGASAAKGSIHAIAKAPARTMVALREARVAQILGIDVPWATSTAILGRLGFRLAEQVQGGARFEVPTHRPDVSREIDLIEEIGRVVGFDAIPAVLPAIAPTREDDVTRESTLARARAVAVAIGLYEAVTYAYSDEASLAAVHAPAPAVKVKNPLNESQSVMRTSLLPSLLGCVDRAARRGERSTRYFTMGPLFLAPDASRAKSADDAALPNERMAFAAVITGERDAWLAKPSPVDVWDAKGIAVAMVERLARREAKIAAFDDARRPKHLHPRGAAEVLVGETSVGRFGLLHPDVKDAVKLEGSGDVVVCEIDLAAIDALGRAAPRYRPIPRFPASARDLAVVVKDDVRAGDVEDAVRRVAGDLAEGVSLFDRFTGGAVPADHASLAFRVVYRSVDRTLTDAEVDAQHAKVISEVTTRFGATLRA